MPDGCARGELDEGLGRAALGLVAPAVGDGPDLLEAERRVTWPVTVSASTSRTFWPLVDLEGAREVRRDGRLADAALRVEDRDDGRAGPSRPSIGPPWRTGPLPSSTVWRRMHIASTRQRIDSAE